MFLHGLRVVNNSDDDKLYQEGKAVEIDYVAQKFKEKAWKGPIESEKVIEIRVEE